mmetsp:Transcript_70987/g.166567  ORF Transcript_70987/g.166567 Transcript_70987/m.166567 type:complete len:202 (-) Transcript_70987:587-1192(-)
MAVLLASPAHGLAAGRGGRCGRPAHAGLGPYGRGTTGGRGHCHWAAGTLLLASALGGTTTGAEPDWHKATAVSSFGTGPGGGAGGAGGGSGGLSLALASSAAAARAPCRLPADGSGVCVAPPRNVFEEAPRDADGLWPTAPPVRFPISLIIRSYSSSSSLFFSASSFQSTFSFWCCSIACLQSEATWPLSPQIVHFTSAIL